MFRAFGIVGVLLFIGADLHAEGPALWNGNGSDSAFSEPPSFRHDVMAVLSKSGCNLGTCHGNQNGKGGFRLSLRGQDPDTDFMTLTRQLGGRRVSPLEPDRSLLLQKPLMKIPHEGGRRLTESDDAYVILRDWIEGGMLDDRSSAAQLVELRLTPSLSTVLATAGSVQLRVEAEFSDGSIRDVTRLSVFESSWPTAEVTRDGLVSLYTIGEASDKNSEASGASSGASVASGLTTVTARYLNHQTAARVEFIRDDPEFQFSSPAVATSFDRAVFRQLERLRIQPAGICDDRTFLRRVYLDVTGLLPPPERAQEFLASSEEDKRIRLIDDLLASEEFIDNQALRWADLLRVEEKTLDRKGVSVFYRWIRESISADKPLPEFAQEILSARGSTYTEPATNFYRALRTSEERAEASAQLFLGIRLQCAKCHNHPFDRWTQDDYYGWSNFFARIDYKIIENKRRDTNDTHEFDGEQIVFVKNEGDVKNPGTGRVPPLRFPGEAGQSNVETETTESDRLQQLGTWISARGNERFSVTQANRIWYQLFGKGVVDPIDDFRATNPPSNPELLSLIVRQFENGGSRIRPLMREILRSSTYQLAADVNESSRNDDVCFSHVEARRLTAEQLLDAISQVTGSTPQYGESKDQKRAVQLVGVRNGGHRYSPPESGDRFLQLFGKPDRLQTCECERSEETTLSQTFEMVSGQLIHELMRSRDGLIATAVRNKTGPSDFLEQLYWRALSRSPSDTEREALRQYAESHRDLRAAYEDIMWAVLNSNEFLLRP
ncbi:MAG: DUF1549 domain-containing protein [Planctomyces sp.]|nr:DUF1549 domain-containing protein [Planctomyces sp.]